MEMQLDSELQTKVDLDKEADQNVITASEHSYRTQSDEISVTSSAVSNQVIHLQRNS